MGADVTLCPDCGQKHAGELVCSKWVMSCATEEVPLPVPRNSSGPSTAAIEEALGDFKLVRQIGIGSMGTVYVAEHRMIGSKVAVKVLRSGFASRPDLVKNFWDEARAVNRIGHPGIVSIFDLKHIPPNHYFQVMELLEGRPLSALVGKLVKPKKLVPLLAQICDALDAAHRVGVVHQDVKPQNVFLVRGARSERVKLLDFGAARLLTGSPAPGPSKTVRGTPAFMPPEQWRDESIDGRTDVYALGVTAYLLATGKLPFPVKNRPLPELYRDHRDLPRPDPRSLQPNLPPALAEIIVRAMSKRRDDRYQTAADMAEALRSIFRKRRSVTSAENATEFAAANYSLTTAELQPETYVEPGAHTIQISAQLWSSQYLAQGSTATSLTGVARRSAA